MRVTYAAAILLFLFAAARASAEPSIHLELRDGRVWLTARNAPVAAILREWARVGGVRIVNGDAVQGAPLTLDLTAVPERVALDTILRGTAGYIVAGPAHASFGTVAVARILILPKTAMPPLPVSATAARRTTGARDTSVPEPLAALVRSGITGYSERQPPEDGNEAQGEPLPDPLAELLRKGIAPVPLPIPIESSKTSPAVPASPPPAH